MPHRTSRRSNLAALTVLILSILTLAGAAQADHRPAPLMDFVPQEAGFYDTYHVNLTEPDCRACHGQTTADRHHVSSSALSGFCLLCHEVGPPPQSEIVVLKNCLLSACHDPSAGSPHHTTGRAWLMECTTCHNPQLVAPFGPVLDPVAEPSLVAAPTPDSCENCHWAQPLTEQLPSTDQHYTGQGILWANHQFDVPGFSLQPLELGDPGDNGWLYHLPINGNHGTHHVGGLEHDCTNCHAYADGLPGPEPDDPNLIRYCQRCHTPESLHAVKAHVESYEGLLSPGNACNAAGWEAAEVSGAGEAAVYRFFGTTERCAGCHGSVPPEPYLTQPQPPYLQSVSPNAGEPGAIVTLVGSGFGPQFAPGCAVQANGAGTGGVWVNLPPVTWSEGYVSVLVPPWLLPVGNYYLRLVTPNGTSNERAFSRTDCPCGLMQVDTNMNGNSGPLYCQATLLSPLLPQAAFYPLSINLDSAEVYSFHQLLLEPRGGGRTLIVADAKLRPSSPPSPHASLSGKSPAVTWGAASVTFNLTKFWEDASGNYTCEGEAGQAENAAVDIATIAPGDYGVRLRSVYWKDWNGNGYLDQPYPGQPADPANEAILATLSEAAPLTITTQPYIKLFKPKPVVAGKVVTLVGINFGATQEESTVNIYKADGVTLISQLTAESRRQRLWEERKVKFRMPGKPGQTRHISVTVGGQESNRVKVKLQ